MRFMSEAVNGDMREIVRHFTPNWFAANMGTGILALMLSLFPYGHWGQLSIARGLWIINAVFFTVFALLFIGRGIFYPQSFRRIFDHPIQSLFLGAIPMGFATIINGFFLIWPLSATTLQIATSFWWIDVLLSLASVLIVPFFMFTSQGHSMERMTAAWLLPVVPPEVAAASGGLLAPHLTVAAAQNVIFTSYALWAISVPLALSILAILLLRLTLHKLPHQDMAVSAWLPLGPLGTGAMAMLTLGNADPQVFTGNLAGMAHFALHGGLFIAMMLWGYGLWWMLIAIFFTLRYLREGLPFNMGWWGFTFPLGVFNSSTYLLADHTGYWLFAPLGAFFTLLLAFFWIVVTKKSFWGMWTGRLFRAPCLAEETCLSQETGLPETGLAAFAPITEDLMSELRK